MIYAVTGRNEPRAWDSNFEAEVPRRRSQPATLGISRLLGIPTIASNADDGSRGETQGLSE